MHSSQEKQQSAKIFQPLKDLKKYFEINNTKERLLYECPVFLKTGECEANAKIKFLRFYETYILISTCKSFVHFKIAFYGFHLSVSFKYSQSESKYGKTLKSFELISEEQTLEFLSLNHLDLLNIHRVLKTKLNFQGFHDHFKAIKKIGSGNFAIVYMAQSSLDGKDYAVKAMNKAHLRKQINGIASFENEIKILRSLDHINLIRLDSVYESNNSYYIVMELFYGGNLKDYVKSCGVLSEKRASKLMKNILKGVKFMHSRNIMHRDIKPENILFRSKTISDETQVVLADMGLATYNNVEKYLFPRCGTPGFVAPEIALIKDTDDHYELKCDLYSFGVTLYFILTGRLPYPGKNDLIRENKDCIVDFAKSEIYRNLSNEAKDFISSLVCTVDKRISIDQALNHQFFKIHEEIKSESDECENVYEEDESIENILLSSKIEEINMRKIILNEKNLFSKSPVNSPLLKLRNSTIKNKPSDKSLTFICLTPLLTGFTKTVKSICILNGEDFLLNEDEDNEYSISTFSNCLVSHEFKLIKTLK